MVSQYFHNRNGNKSGFGTTIYYEVNNPSKVQSELKRSGGGNTINPGRSNLPIGRWGDDTRGAWYVWDRMQWPASETINNRNVPAVTSLPTPVEGQEINLPNGSFSPNQSSVDENGKPIQTTDANGNVIPFHRENGGVMPGIGKDSYMIRDFSEKEPFIREHEPRFIGDYPHPPGYLPKKIEQKPF